MMRLLYFVSIILTILGALNWGLVGLANINLVEMIFGAGALLTKIIYIAIGAAAVIYSVSVLTDHRPQC